MHNLSTKVEESWFVHKNIIFLYNTTTTSTNNNINNHVSICLSKIVYDNNKQLFLSNINLTKGSEI